MRTAQYFRNGESFPLSGFLNTVIGRWGIDDEDTYVHYLRGDEISLAKVNSTLYLPL